MSAPYGPGNQYLRPGATPPPGEAGQPAPTWPQPTSYPSGGYPKSYPAGGSYPVQPGPSGPVERSRVGAAVGVLGLTLFITGMFGFALESYGTRRVKNDFYAGTFSSLARQDFHKLYLNGPAAFWWGYGVYVVVAALALALAWTALAPARLPALVLLALVVLAAIGYVLALLGTGDYIKVTQGFKRSGSPLDHPGIGIWITVAGLVVLLVAAVLAIVKGDAKRGV